MSVINRGLLFFYTIFVAVFACLALFVLLGGMSDDALWNEFSYVRSHWQFHAVAGIVLLASIKLFFASFCTSGEKKLDNEAVVVQGDMGDVYVAIPAIRDMIEKAAGSCHGVREANSSVEFINGKNDSEIGKLKIGIHIVIGQEHKVSVISDSIRKSVTERMEAVVGVSEFDMDIRVDEIASTPAKKRQRVV